MALLGTILEPEHATHTGGAWTLSDDIWWTDSTWGLLRGGLYANGGVTNTLLIKQFSSTKTTFCACGKWRWFFGSAWVPFFGFSSGTTPVMRFCVSYASGNYYITLQKLDPSDSSWDTIATSDAISNTNFRAEAMIEDHGSDARVRLWLRYWNETDGQLKYGGPHNLVLDYSGDTTVTGYDLDGVWIAPITNGYCEMGPVIAADEPTHRYECFPVAITGAGDVNTMASGTYADIDEVNADTTDYVESDTDDQKILCAAGDLPDAALAVVGVELGALASSTSGPTHALLGIKSGGTEDWADTAHALGAGWSNIQRLMTTNPVTGNAWTVSEVNAMQYGVKSTTPT